jgi:HEAT repeats
MAAEALRPTSRARRAPEPPDADGPFPRRVLPVVPAALGAAQADVAGVVAEGLASLVEPVPAETDRARVNLVDDHPSSFSSKETLTPPIEPVWSELPPSANCGMASREGKMTGAAPEACAFVVNMTAAPTGHNEEVIIWGPAAQYLQRFFSSTRKQKARLVKKAPLQDLHAMALHHQDPSVRRGCLFFLDHYANEASTNAFTAALQDPVATVRYAALHSIACESCRSTELSVVEVVPAIAGVLGSDPDPNLRAKAIPTLLRLAGRDPSAWEAIQRTAQKDKDEVVRRAAEDALHGAFSTPAKRLDRRRRRHHQTSQPVRN